jgi:hypothetical protein
VTLNAASDAQQQSVIDQFRARNPGAQQKGPMVEPLGNFLRTSGLMGNPIPVSRVDPGDAARALVRKNADLLGLTPSEVDALEIKVRDARFGPPTYVELKGIVPKAARMTILWTGGIAPSRRARGNVPAPGNTAPAFDERTDPG